jgi:transcription elongation factor
LIQEACILSLQQLNEELWVDDKVELLGAHLGCIGTVTHIVNGIATVLIKGEEGKEMVDVLMRELRKYFALHDFVDVASGAHEGKSGWVLKYSHDIHNQGEVVLSEVSSCAEVSDFLDSGHPY